MKTTYHLLVFALLLTSACKKGNSVNPSKAPVDTTQATIVTDQTAYGNTFTTQDSLIAIELMKNNDLSTDGLVFYQYQAYTALDNDNKQGFFQLPSAMQVRNGLPVFLEDLNLSFENGRLYGPYPAPQFIVGTISLDNKPKLNLQNVRQFFIKEDNATEAHSISIEDSTLVAKLGYYNLNIDQLGSGGAPNYVKAWYVHPQHSFSAWGYFRDDNGAPILFRPTTPKGPVGPGQF
jgi:hypothetical protein